MERSSNSYSVLVEKEFFELLASAASGSSEQNKRNRIEGLEEFQRRISSNAIQDRDEAIRTLLDIAKVQGDNKPESALIIECLTLFINKCGEVFQIVLDRLAEQEEKTFLIFSKVALSLDYNKKRQAIKPLTDFLMTRDALTKAGVKETCDCLISLGNEGLDQEIVEAASPYLDSSTFEICAIFYSVKLCAEFADHKLLPKMLAVLHRSMKSQFDGYYVYIEGAICEFLKRVGDGQSLTTLIDLLKIRSTEQSPHIYEAIASVLNANPSLIEDILEKLYDERHNKDFVNGLLQSAAKTDKPRIDVPKLLSNIRINWWWEYPTNDFMREILTKQGKGSKPSLLDIIKQGSSADANKFSFALECLKSIGVSKEEISAIFPKHPILQIYNYFYKGKKNSENLNQIWKEKEKLRDNLPGYTNRLEHLLLHIFLSFGFITINLAPLQKEGVDLVSFCPETLDLFVVGCTTSIIKDDLAKMDVQVRKMKVELADLLSECSITPIVVCSEVASISPADAQYAFQNQIVIMQPNHIDTLLEMLDTNRQGRETIDFIKRMSPN